MGTVEGDHPVGPAVSGASGPAADASSAGSPSSTFVDGVLAFAALLVAGVAGVLLLTPLDAYRRWSADGAPGQELLFTVLLVALLLVALAGWVVTWVGYRRFPRPLPAWSLLSAPGHVVLLASMLAIAWYGVVPGARAGRLLMAAWLAARLLIAATAILGAVLGPRSLMVRSAPAMPIRYARSARALLGVTSGLVLLAGIDRLPWSLDVLVPRVGSTVVLLDLLTLAALLMPAARRSVAVRPYYSYLLANTVARLLADAMASLAGGVHDDLFTIAQLASLVSMVTWVVGLIRETLAQNELSLLERARLQEMERELAREREEQATREMSGAWTRELLRDLLKAVEAMRIGLTVSSPEGRIVYVNPADAELHGWDRDELLGQPVQVYSPAPRPGPAGDPHPWLRESENVTRQGVRFPVRLHSDFVRDQEGRVVARVTLCEDIRDELQARADLYASEARYRAVVESASDLILSVDAEGHVNFVNDAWSAALGWSREEAVGLSVWDIVPPEEHERLRTALEQVMAGESRSNVVSTFLARSGERLRVEGNVAPQLEAGRPVAALAIFRNVTERERLARMKDEFVATVSHELRTPLTSMLGAMSLLRGARLDDHPERRSELTEVAVRNGERLLRLVNELLDVQKLEAGQLRVQLVNADVAGLLEEASNGVEALADSKGVRLHLACEPALRVRCDRDRLVQVLFNLLSNAIKFSPAGEEVWARASGADGAIEIDVVDKGPGIPPEFRRQLFEPFTQADSSSARSAGGSGLGLFISRRLVEAMGGTIRVEEGDGGGTRAVVTVPRAAEPVGVAARA